jgi:hypothetical protein
MTAANGTLDRHSGILLGRCNPYGAETGGPRRVLGGLYGPGSAATPGMDLPASVAQGEWPCARAAEVRCRMWCRCGHKGQLMALCSWHDEPVMRSEMVARAIRVIRGTTRQHGHFEEIQRRQSGSCPACLFPPPYAELMREVQGWQAQLSGYWQAGLWGDPAAASLRTRIDDAGKLMDLARAQGTIHNCPLTLKAVS